MQTSPRVRKHRTPAQRKEILEAYRRSGLSQNQFAAQAGMSVSTLNVWLRQDLAPPSPGAGFVQIPNLLPPAPVLAAYRVHLPSGVILEVREGFQTQELGSLLQLAKAL